MGKQKAQAFGERTTAVVDPELSPMTTQFILEFSGFVRRMSLSPHSSGTMIRLAFGPIYRHMHDVRWVGTWGRPGELNLRLSSSLLSPNHAGAPSWPSRRVRLKTVGTCQGHDLPVSSRFVRLTWLYLNNQLIIISVLSSVSPLWTAFVA